MAHALKCGSTGAYKEDTNGAPVYDWTINDRIFDTYLAHGIKPYVQIGFMPEALTTHPQNYPHHPPVNERAPVRADSRIRPRITPNGVNLAYEWAKHCVEKYGQAEVEKWYWEVWNEPNIMLLARHARGLFQALRLRGGRRAPRPADGAGRRPGNRRRAGREISARISEHCVHGTNYVTGKTGSPLDFVSFHAKGSPSSPTATSAWAWPTSCATSTTPSP